VRAPAARHRATLPDARERERRFREVSRSYVEATGDASTLDGHSRRIDVDGLTFWVPLIAPDNAAAVERYLQHQHFPYPAITQTREVGMGGIMLDIGGNNGRMSIPRVVLGDVQAAYCAEPELVMPDRVAIGAENGSVRMLRAKSPGGHRVIDREAKSKRETIDVPCLTLDSWCEQLGIDVQQVSFVKLDTQGSEVHVLRGASQLLTCRQIAWQIEIDVLLLRERGFGAGDLYAILQRHFTHWIDLNRRARGARLRPIDRLGNGLSYIQRARGGRTDILVFSLQPPSPLAVAES
jgi:hypothetical protein